MVAHHTALTMLWRPGLHLTWELWRELGTELGWELGRDLWEP